MNTEISGDIAGGFTVKNTHTPETIDISGSKTWVEYAYGDDLRPEKIVIRLYADGTELTDKTETVKPDQFGNWTWKFSGLPNTRRARDRIHHYRGSSGSLHY